MNIKIISRSEAQRQGLLHYFSGKLCPHKHVSPRYTSSKQCVQCRSEQTSDWKIKNRELELTQRRNWRQSNLQSEREKGRAWAAANLHKINAKSAARRARKKNSQVINARYSKELKTVYKNCPEGFVVDHIIPLAHPLVSGLHVPWNLQYLTPNENSIKSNSFDGGWLQTQLN
jgi:hypothetical protein